MLRIWFAALIAMINVAPAAFSAEPSPTPDHIISRIPRQPVQSTAIAKVGYSKRRRILEIEFVNGAVYRYLDVPPTVYRDLMSAESKARFYDLTSRAIIDPFRFDHRKSNKCPRNHPPPHKATARQGTNRRENFPCRKMLAVIRIIRQKAFSLVLIRG